MPHVQRARPKAYVPSDCRQQTTATLQRLLSFDGGNWSSCPHTCRSQYPVGIGSGGWQAFAEAPSSPQPLLQRKPLEHAGQLGEVRFCLQVEDEVQ